MQVGEEHVPLADPGALLLLRFLDLDDELGSLPRIADARAGLLISRIRGADAAAGIGLDHHLMAVRDELAHRSRGQTHPVFMRLYFLRDTDDHRRGLWRAQNRSAR